MVKSAMRAIVVVCLALALASCGRSATYRYKLTLSLDTPEGVKTAFNVVDEKGWEVVIPERGFAFTTTGQAIYLDLGSGRRPLIALLTKIRRAGRSSNDDRWSDGPDLSLFTPCLPAQLSQILYDVDRELATVREIAKCDKTIKLAVADLPDLVTFADVNDPSSILHVDPNNLEATLGPGVSWQSVTLQATNEPPTKAMDEHLPWVRLYRDNIHIGGINSFQYGTNAFLNSFDFISGS